MRYRPKIKILIFITLFLFFIFNASLTLAQEIKYPNLPGVEEPQNFLKTAEGGEILSFWLKYIIALLTWSTGILAFLFLIIGGIQYLISSGNPDKMKDAKNRIIGSFLGLTIVLSFYAILGVLGPRFVNPTIPNLENFGSILKYPKEPEVSELTSEISVYLPIGRLIETIFETYISRVPTKDNPIPEGALTRIQRITNILDATSSLLPGILIQAETLKDLSKECSCLKYTDPDPRCDSSGCGTCFPKFCTGDPCSNARGDIIAEELEMRPYLFESEDGEDGSIEVVQHDAYGKEFTINTNLSKEIDRTEEEIRLLKDLFGKLGRAEQVINECDLLTLTNVNEYYQKKDAFDANDWFSDAVNFFDDIDATYNQPANPKTVQDRWYPLPGTAMKQIQLDNSTLYCSVGGTYIRQPIDFETEPAWVEKRIKELDDMSDEKRDSMAEEMFDNTFHYELSCDIMIPFGEIMDKAHRNTRLLINRLEIIVDREKKILEATEQLQVLISRCSSRLCFPFCLCVTPPSGPQYCIEVGCFGPACPRSQINSEFRKIRRYIEEIQEAIDGVEPYDTPKTISLKLLFEEVVPDLLQGMEESLRAPLSQCASEAEGEDVSILRCDEALGGTDQFGRLIESCEAGTNGEWQDTYYGACLNKCFIAKIASGSYENSDYRVCVKDCLANLCVYKTRHKYNLHCCHIEYGK